MQNEHIETTTERLGYRRYRVTRRAYVTRGRVLVAEGAAEDTTITKAHRAAGLALTRARAGR